MQNNLLHLGLNKHEASIYKALLELGPASVTQITKKAGLTRTFGYPILEKMSEQGLVLRASGEGKKIKYTVQHPRRLVQYIQNCRNQWDRRLKEVENILPELVSLYRVAEKPVIRYQEGVAGVKAIYEETLESKEEILSILDIEGWDVPEFRNWGKNYNRQRSLKNIHERILILDTKQGRDWMENYRGSLKYTDYRWIILEQLPFIKDLGGEINIFENKVVMALLKQPNLMGVIIESSTLANILKSLFNLAWSQGTPAGK